MRDDPDEPDANTWPSELVEAAEVRAWIAHALPRQPGVVGPLAVFQAKEWGVTARFGATSGGSSTEYDIVFKASALPLFRDAPLVESLLSRTCPAMVPELLAWERRGNAAWMLYRAFSGVSVAAMGDLSPLLGMARVLAAIQGSIAVLAESELAPLPRVPLREFPAIFDTVLADVRARQLAFWRDEGRDLVAQFSLPDDVGERMAAFRREIPRWVDELAAGGWPLSLDHVDLQSDNAVVRPGGGILIYDWEEANLSCPFFSLDRLLDDARDLAGEDGERQLRAAYLDALPWGTRVARERALSVALCLSPLKHAYEALRLADALGWREGAPHVTAWALARALPRWQAFAAASPPAITPSAHDA